MSDPWFTSEGATMLCRILAVLAFLTLLASTTTAEEEKARPKPLKPTSKFAGSVADGSLESRAPADGVITNEKDLESLWKAWQLGDKMPKVDFRKELVVVATTRGSRLNLTATLDDAGDLRVLALSTRDLRPGFRYSIQVIEREGIKTVNGKKL